MVVENVVNTKVSTDAVKFTRVNYTNWSAAIFEGFYESSLYNSDTMYYINENDRGETEIDENGNEVPILAEDEAWDIVGDNWNKFKLDICEHAVDKLEELATEYKEPSNYILKDFKLQKLYSPQYYNYETDRLNIDMDVNIRALEEFCFYTNKDDFNNYLQDNFTSYDGYISYIDNNINDFRFTYNTKGTDSIELDCMIEYYLLTCIYNTTDLRSIDNIYADGYRYHTDLAEYASECVYSYMTKEKI